MPLEERYAYLLGWVLPGEDHTACRLDGDFTPTDPAPPVQRLDLAESVAIEGTNRVHIGGTLEAPALELVAVAKEVNKLNELGARVEDLATRSLDDERAKLSMLSLIVTAQDRDEAAEGLLKQLYTLMAKLPQDAHENVRWCDLTAASNAVTRRRCSAISR